MIVGVKMTSDKPVKSQGFDYRSVLGAWINDVCSVPRIGQWPSIELDETLERDLAGYFDVMKDLKLDFIVLAGLLVTHNWQPDFAATVSPQRAKAVRRILAAAHQRNVKVLYGLGLYSWGFYDIIKADPGVRGTNPYVMCGSSEASHDTMERLMDYLVSEFPVDGFHFESADNGRCECDQCKPKGDSLYHRELNERMGKYVHSKWPEMPIEVYCPIQRGNKEDWLIWADASKHFTFFIDPYDFARRFGRNSRKEIVSAFQCAYGTRSGTWIYPPQRWDRLRWFVPIIEKRAVHYQNLAADGGKAVIIQGTPLANPGEEASLRCSGKLASDYSRRVESVLVEVMEEMFRPRRRIVAEDLADIFWSAEKAYWCNANFLTEGGELLLEPLFGAGKAPGPPIYLETRMYAHDIDLYERAMMDIKRRFLSLQDELGDRDRASRVVTCLNNVLEDIGGIKARHSMLPCPF